MRSEKKNRQEELPLSSSWPCREDFEVGIGVRLIISGRVVALKYCFPGCSLVLCSREYCSRVFKRYFFSFWVRCGFQTSTESKNWLVCLPVFSILNGGILEKRSNISRI